MDVICVPPQILSSHTRTQLVQLTLAEMQRFFTIIILGLGASVAVLLAEVIAQKKKKIKKKKITKSMWVHDTLM